MFAGLWTAASRDSELPVTESILLRMRQRGFASREVHLDGFRHLQAWESRIPSQCTGPHAPFSGSPWYIDDEGMPCGSLMPWFLAGLTLDLPKLDLFVPPVFPL